MTDKAICMWAECEMRVWGDHKISVTPNGGIAKLYTRMIGGITKYHNRIPTDFVVPSLPLFRLCPLVTLVLRTSYTWSLSLVVLNHLTNLFGQMTKCCPRQNPWTLNSVHTSRTIISRD